MKPAVAVLVLVFAALQSVTLIDCGCVVCLNQGGCMSCPDPGTRTGNKPGC